MSRSVAVKIRLPLEVYQEFARESARIFKPIVEHVRDMLIAKWLERSSEKHSTPHDKRRQNVTDLPPLESKNPGQKRFKPPRSGFRGVYAYGRRWAAWLIHNGERTRVGVANTPEEAARLYDLAANAAIGPGAILNFPEPATGSSTTLEQINDAWIARLATGPISPDEMRQWERETAPFMQAVEELETEEIDG